MYPENSKPKLTKKEIDKLLTNAIASVAGCNREIDDLGFGLQDHIIVSKSEKYIKWIINNALISCYHYLLNTYDWGNEETKCIDENTKQTKTD